MKEEIVALLFPDRTVAGDESPPTVTALLRDAQGAMEVRQLKPDRSLLSRARIAGRFNRGTPILDPETREVIGYDIEPLAIGAA